MKKIFIQTIAFFAVIIIFIQTSDAQNQTVLREAEKITKDKFSVSTQTPKGAQVFSVRQPSAQMMNAIDKGLTDLFAVAKKAKYRKRLNYSDYTIFIGNADRTKNADGNYSPDIAVGAAQYAGSIYDQGGFIYAAGMIISNNSCAFVIAEHTKDLGRVSDVVRYEGEHLVLFHNDRKKYRETADHSQGGGHPILQ